MRRLILAILMLFIMPLSTIGQGQIKGVDIVMPNNDIKEFNGLNKLERKYFRQFVIPIESGGVSINNGIRLTITANFINNHDYAIRLADLNSSGISLLVAEI